MAASYNLMLDLFVDCNRIREFCNRLQVEAEKMQEVSMNAAIAAGHTGSHIRTFTEIARQIGNSSARLSAKIQKMRADTNSIVNETLDGMIRSSHLSSFEKCLPRMKGESNIELVKARMTELESRVGECVERIFRDLHRVASDIRAVEEIQKRVWAVITRLRIEASTMEQSEQVFVSSIADSLGESIERASKAFEQLLETVRQFEGRLSSSKGLGEPERESKYAS